MKSLAITLLLAGSAAAAPPKHCDIAFVIQAVTKGDVTAKVASIKPAERGLAIALDQGLTFRYITELPTPFKTGDTLHVTYRCGGPPPGIYCDARIADAKDRTLVISALNSSDDYSDGWTAKPGKILTSRQNPNETRTSIEHGHELILTRGKTTATVVGGACSAVTDGTSKWYATGTARSWEGVRPPEGIDYKTYSISRAD